MLRSRLKRALPLHLHPYPLFERAIRRASGGRVLSGPFAGIRWAEESVGSYLLPRVLGTYERELHRSFEQLAARTIDTITVIGAGEGYYVAGLKRLFPRAPITAFELEERGREIIMRVANANAIDVTMYGACSAAELHRVLSPSGVPLVLIDVEGAEQEILDPSLVPELLRAVIIAEVHEAYRPGVEAVLRERFSSSHRIVRIDPEPRTSRDFPLAWGRFVSLFDGRYALWSMGEGRPEGIFWLIMEPVQ